MIDLSVISNDFKGYYVAALTDEYKVGFWPIVDDFDIVMTTGKLLEFRVFNEDVEYKWFRGNISEELSYRKLADDDKTSEKYERAIEEQQLLDLDFKKSDSYKMPGTVNMSRGGKFYLPLPEGEISKSDKPGIIVKYYVPKYDPNDSTTVHAYVKDWRLAGFTKGVK